MAKRKEYLQFLPVSSDKTADMLKTEAVWQVLKKIREKGGKGITAEQIAEELQIPLSTVYNALKPLEWTRFIRAKKKRVGRPKKGEVPIETKRPGKAPKVYYEPCEERAYLIFDPAGEPENPWGDVIFSREFSEQIAPLLKKDFQQIKIEKTIIDFIKKFYQELLKKKGAIRSVLPGEEICPLCGINHEGGELVKAMIIYIATCVLESKTCKELLKELNLAKR